MQASAADGGGFKGRTNKLVDGCYGWWVGGSLTVLEEMSKLRLGTKQEQGQFALLRVLLRHSSC